MDLFISKYHWVSLHVKLSWWPHDSTTSGNIWFFQYAYLILLWFWCFWVWVTVSVFGGRVDGDGGFIIGVGI